MTPLVTVLVGLGQIGLGYDLAMDPDRYIYTHARAMTRHPRFQLLVGIDPDVAARVQLEQTYGVHGYACLADLPRKAAVDLVIIASATEAHGLVLDEVLARMCPRAILCEKPLSYDPTEARRMVDACEARGVALFINYIRRADPAAIEIKRRIEADEITQPLKGVVWYSKGFLHNGSHFVDLLGHWLGPIVSASVIAPGRSRGATDGEPDVRIVFDRGGVVFLAAPEEAFSHYTIELIAGNGRLRYDRGGEKIEWRSAVPHPRLPGYTVLSEDSETVISGMDRYQWHVADQLAAAMDGRDHHLCSGHQAMATQARMHVLLEERCP